MVALAPAWYTEIADNRAPFFEGRATSVSQDMQLAVDNAATDARAQLAQAVEVYVENTVRTASDQAGVAGNESAIRFRQSAGRQVVQATLRGVQIDRQEIRAEPDGRVRAYVRVRMMKGEAQDALQSQIRREQELYARLRGTEALRQLEADVDAYERFKAGQSPVSPRPR